MKTTAQQIRAYEGPALFTYGFRPFFLFGAIWAALAVALWLPMLTGHLDLPTKLSPLEWHVHELIFGYVPAIVAGFLLTAVPNWTGRLPVVGPRLMALFALWCAGRVAISSSAWTGLAFAATVDLAFLATFAAVIAREIVAGSNWKNLKVVAALCLLFTGNALFHLEALGRISGGYGMRLGLATIVLLITLIGGRIIPSFTRNWLVRQAAGRLPVPFNMFDSILMVGTAVVLAAWVLMPSSLATAYLAAVAGILHVARLARWAGDRAAREPLVLVLHVAYAFVPLGFLLLAAAIAWPDALVASGALHSWTAGAVGLMTLAVMTRASLGHTGRPLLATSGITGIYVCAAVSALARIVAAFGVLRMPMLDIAAVAWVMAFGGFVIVFAPLLLRRRA